MAPSASVALLVAAAVPPPSARPGRLAARLEGRRGVAALAEDAVLAGVLDRGLPGAQEIGPDREHVLRALQVEDRQPLLAEDAAHRLVERALAQRVEHQPAHPER